MYRLLRLNVERLVSTDKERDLLLKEGFKEIMVEQQQLTEPELPEEVTDPIEEVEEEPIKEAEEEKTTSKRGKSGSK